MTVLVTVLAVVVLVVCVLALVCVLDALDDLEGSVSPGLEAEAEIRRMRKQVVRDLFAAEAAVRSSSPDDYIDGTAREVMRR